MKSYNRRNNLLTFRAILLGCLLSAGVIALLKTGHSEAMSARAQEVPTVTCSATPPYPLVNQTTFPLRSIAVGKINQVGPESDTHFDLSIPVQVFSHTTKVENWYGNGAGRFCQPSSGVLNQSDAPVVHILTDDYIKGALNNNITDTVIVRAGSPGKVLLYRGSGTGGFLDNQREVEVGQVLEQPNVGVILVAGDFVSDSPENKIDFAVLADNQLKIIKNNSTLTGNVLGGTLEVISSFPIPSGFTAFSLVAGDFNNTGQPDVVVVANNSSTNSTKLFALYDRSNLQFPVVDVTLPISAKFVTAGKFNADTADDLAITTASGIQSLFGNSTSFIFGTLLSATSPGYVVTGDFNGDAKDDIAAITNTNNVTVFTGTGEGTFTTLPSYAVGNEPVAMVAVKTAPMTPEPLAIVRQTDKSIFILNVVPMISPATLLGGFIGKSYSQTLTATDGNGQYTFSVSSGTLPPGISLSNGALTGTPTTVGSFTFTIAATDANGVAGTRQYTLVISGDGLLFYPLPSPVRLLETRAGLMGCTNPGAPINANGTLTLLARTLCAGIPADAAAITGNITVVPSGPGFLTLFPSTATQPLVANSNFVAGEITNNVFTVGLGAGDGAFKIFSSATTEVIVDVTGYYAPPGTGGLYFHPLSSPVRLLETREGLTGCITPGAPLIGTGNPNADPNLDLVLAGRSPIASPCHSIPATAQVLVGNATSITPSGLGYLTIYPSDATRPTVASSNYAGGDVINGPFAVKLGADGKFKVYTLSTTELVIDIIGYYSAEASDTNGVGLLFTALPSPVRLLETRPDLPGFSLMGCTRPNAPIPGNVEMATHTQMAANFCGLPSAAQAVVGNVSVVNTSGAGFLTLFPANLTTAPLVATSNYPVPATFGYNRHFIVGLSSADGKFKVRTNFTTDLILDASGYFAP